MSNNTNRTEDIREQQKKLKQSIGEIEINRYLETNFMFIIKSKQGIIFECCAEQLIDDTYEYVIAYNTDDSDYAQNGIVFKSIKGLCERLSREDMYDDYSGEPIVSTEEKSLVVKIGKYMINEVESTINK